MDKINVHYTLPTISKRFAEYIKKSDYDYRDGRSSSVMDYLCVIYAENQDADPKEIKDGFAALDNYLKCVSLDDNNAIFSIVCNLCSRYEERAFKDGLQLGAYLILELQGK